MERDREKTRGEEGRDRRSEIGGEGGSCRATKTSESEHRVVSNLPPSSLFYPLFPSFFFFLLLLSIPPLPFFSFPFSFSSFSSSGSFSSFPAALRSAAQVNSSGEKSKEEGVEEEK